MADLLIVDDERNLRELLALSLSQEGHRVMKAAHGTEALRLLDEQPCDLVITDLKLPDMSGLEVLRHARRAAPERPVLLITAYASTETAVTAIKEGAFEYLEKPFRMEDLHLLVLRALEQGALKQENVQLKRALGAKEDLSGLSARGPAMKKVMELVERAARTDATVLITGESGTGKEVAARAVHRLSARGSKPFVAINCGAIPENLMESELFGHAKGAFSGAVASRKGVFVEADGGTLLLDEIGEMTPVTQVKLLRALQERTIRPVGGSGERPVDVRVIATTNRDLVRAVAEQRFREDLFYRINVINLHLPPLRERKEEIPDLASRFLASCAQRHHLPARRLEPEAMECLMQYDFPGNVRELENLIEGAASLAAGEILGVESLPERLRQPSTALAKLLSEIRLTEAGIDLEKILGELEGSLVRQALTLAHGNKTRAAELLGLSFRSLRYRLAKMEGTPDEEGG
ncbi:MAG: sigma-54-dependent Fis family transcriptional regulator [Magnetococcales bacterium]|nr:sigma-54-dependent Fis family transcriptional regulator [Magnetococcales bacterium]